MKTTIQNDLLGSITYDSEDYVGRSIAKDGIYEEHMVNKFKSLIKKEDIVLDIGSNIGLHTVLFSKLAHRVLAFEPYMPNYLFLQQNLFDNKINNVSSFLLGASNKIEVVKIIFTLKNNSGMTRLENGNLTDLNEIQNMSTYTNCIDIDSLELEKVDFIKIDTEGYEEKTLYGAEKTIKKFRPIIAIEDWPKLSLPILESWGYNVEPIPYVQKRTHESADYLAIFKQEK